MFSYASNAVLSKARAMYGNRLKDKDYKKLLGCKNVTEIAIYLKQKTAYKGVLSEMDESDVHRGKLEETLRQQLFYDFAKLGMYDLSVGEKFFSYLISRAEIERIMHGLMFFKSEKSGSYCYPIPQIFEKNTKIDSSKLANIKNYNDFLDAIKNSPYYRVLLPLKPADNTQLDLTKIETALYTYLYKIMFDMINQNLRGKNKVDMNDLFNSYIDLSNLVRIIRMKTNYNLSREYMLDSVLKFGNLRKTQINNFIDAVDNKKMLKDMKNTKLGRMWLINGNGDEINDRAPKHMRYKKCNHCIRFSKSPPVVLMSYIFLKEIELLNITHIIEGIRYGIQTEYIENILIR